MRFAEVFLRLGASLVGWMVLYAHMLWLAVLFRLGCGPDGAEMHTLLFGLAPVTIGMAFALRATRVLEEVHSMLRWLGLPLLLLLPFALRSVWEVFGQVHRAGLAICGDGPAGGWHPWWVAVQVVTLAAVTVAVLLVFRNVAQDAKRDLRPR